MIARASHIVERQIKRFFHNRFAVAIDFGKFDVSISPAGARIDAQELQLRRTGDDKPFLSCEKAMVMGSILTALGGKLHISKLVLKQPQLIVELPWRPFSHLTSNTQRISSANAASLSAVNVDAAFVVDGKIEILKSRSHTLRRDPQQAVVAFQAQPITIELVREHSDGYKLTLMVGGIHSFQPLRSLGELRCSVSLSNAPSLSELQSAAFFATMYLHPSLFDAANNE